MALGIRTKAYSTTIKKNIRHQYPIDETSLKKLIDAYQRVTEQYLSEMPDKVHYLYNLERDRSVIKKMQPKKLCLNEHA
jgi:hypothetical protein